MKILYLATEAFGSSGGIAKFNRDLISALNASVVVSDIVAINRNQAFSPKRLPLKLYNNVRGVKGKVQYLREIARMLRAYKKIDLVICGHINLLPVSYIASRLKQARLWCILHGIDAWQPHRNIWINNLLKYTDQFIVVSEFTICRFTDWARIDRDKVFLLHNCYDPADFQVGPKPQYLLDRYNLNGRTNLLTLGRLNSLERYKGFDEVLEILPELVNDIPDISYIIAGAGPDKQRLADKAAKLGVKDRVVFTGYVPENEKVDHYRLADVYVMPGKGEGFGIVYLEAMACGIPVVASKADGSREAVRNGMLGIVVNPQDPGDVKQGILMALKRPKGTPPVGLDYFSVSSFQKRVKELLVIDFQQ